MIPYTHYACMIVVIFIFWIGIKVYFDRQDKLNRESMRKTIAEIKKNNQKTLNNLKEIKRKLK